MPGKLYLIPTVLNENALHVIPAYVHEITKSIHHFFVENERTTRRYLRTSGFAKSFDEVFLYPLNEHTTDKIISTYIKYIMLASHDWGLMSEAGVPAVADPGHLLVQKAHSNNIQVIPLCGPSSIILALMASGLNGQQFSFHGYLPVRQPERNKKIRQLEQKAVSGETQIFIETPYRNNAVISDVLQTCSPATAFCIATNLTGPDESVKTKSIAEWRKQKPEPGKIPAIFLIGKFA